MPKLPRVVYTSDPVIIIAPVDAEACPIQAAAVRSRIAGISLMVDAHMSSIDEDDHLPDVGIALARRYVPPQLRRPFPAVVARCLTDGIGAYAARPAEGEFLRGVEVFLRPLAAVAEVEGKPVVDVLEPREVEVPLAEVPCRVPRHRVVEPLHGLVDHDVAARIGEREGVAPARQEAVEVVPIDAEHPVACAFWVAEGHLPRLAAHALEVEPHGAVEVEVTAATEVVLPVESDAL